MNKLIATALFIGILIAGFSVIPMSHPHKSSDPIIKEGMVKIRDGVQLNYVTSGNKNGTPVILLHGFTDSWKSFELLIKNLPEDIYLFAVTLRGHGDSSKPENGYHPKDFSDDLASLMEELQLSQAIVVGHSLGGLVAQQFVLDYPKLAKGLVIIGSDPNFSDNNGLPEFAEEIKSFTEPIARDYAEGFQKSTLAIEIDPAFLNQCVTETMKVPLHVWKLGIEGVMNVDYRAELVKIKQPTLILWGAADNYCLRSDQESFLQSIENSRLIEYENNGHGLHWEDPVRVAKDLTDFVRSLQ